MKNIFFVFNLISRQITFEWENFQMLSTCLQIFLNFHEITFENQNDANLRKFNLISKYE